MPEPSVSAAYARGLIDLAVSEGADRQALMAGSGVRPGVLSDPDARLPFAKYVDLMRVAIDASGDPALALHYGETIDISQVSIIGLIGQASETMFEALVQLNRYVRLVVDVNLQAADRFELAEDSRGLWLVDTREHPNDFPELTESAFAQMVCGPRHLGVPPFAKGVHVTHARPAHGAEYERIFQAPVTFESDRNAILVDRTLMAHKVARLPRYAFGVLTRHADARLQALERSESARGQVEARLMPILHTGEASMAAVAAGMNTSRQTLYRRLKAEGVTFEQVLDDLRHRLALEYLTTRKVSVNEAAYLVGFSDPAAFSRAFKRWTGRSPRDARRGQQ